MFTPWELLAGGMLIGLASAALLLGQGRIAGISNVVGGSFDAGSGERVWRLAFLGGLVLGGVALSLLLPAAFPATGGAAAGRLMAAGLLVGVGTQLGGGCTSGHGVCGLGRLSPRSLVATLVFMTTGAATVFAVRHVLGTAS